MSIFSDDILQRDTTNPMGEYLKSADLLKGVWSVEKVEIVQSKNSRYGAQEKDALYKSGLLQLGEQLVYTMKDEQGNVRTYCSTGAALFIAVKRANIEPGKRVRFSKVGQGDSTRYEVIPAAD